MVHEIWSILVKRDMIDLKTVANLRLTCKAIASELSIKNIEKWTCEARGSISSCYLLKCRGNKNTYIGKSVNIHHRLRQHNGEIKGGAKATNNESKRPWRHAMAVHGFPSEREALSFEWHWKHPRKSKILRNVSKNNRWVYGLKARLELGKRLMKLNKFAFMPLFAFYD